MATNVDIDRIVREVLRCLSLPTAVAGDTPVANVATNGTGDERWLDGRLVTLSQLDGKLDGTKTVVVGRKAVVTPAVLDLLREKGIELVRRESTNLSPTPRGSLLVALCDNTFDTTSLLELSGQLGYTNETLKADRVQNAVEQLVAKLASPAALAVLITRRAAAAICLANRHHQLRAAWGVDVPSIQSAVATIAANVLVLDSTRNSLVESRNILRTFLSTPRELCPELQAVLE